jgi:hypothetical protein
MKSTLQRICELQRAYSSTNTPEMQERGALIRQTLPQEFRRLETRVRSALGQYSNEFDIGASDGIGRKTEAPWVRICAKSMSPAPTNGFYTVVHFARDGSAVFITVGCGSTVWTANGDLKAVSDKELGTKTSWARQVVSEQFGTLEPFSDIISLGASAPLTRTFEKATAVAKRIPFEELDDLNFENLLVQSVERLRVIYAAQSSGRDLTPSDAAAFELQKISSPTKVLPKGQGFRVSAEDRALIEWRAMDLARAWLEENGYSVSDKSKTASYDFEAVRNDEITKVEVKGTTSDQADAIFMTRNEVDLHRAEMGKTGIIIVSNIRLEKSGGKAIAAGGTLHVDIGWDIDQWVIEPMAYRVARRSPGA